MKLVSLQPEFLRREIRACHVGEPDCHVVSEHTEHEWHVPSSLEEADGISFLCPKCFAENGGTKGTHQVLCWRPRVPLDVSPKPGRWEFQGTGYDDLSLVAGSSSVALRGGCNAHFVIQNGEVTQV